MDRLEVFIDESGQRGYTTKASPHFVMSAVICPATAVPSVEASLSALKVKLGRQPNQQLHFQNLRQHGARVAAAQALGELEPITVISVVICKHAMGDSSLPKEDQAYLEALGYLLERVSWFASDRNSIADYTAAAIVRFPKAKLRSYEANLSKLPPDPSGIRWDHLDPRGGRIDQPFRVPLLQLADIAASSVGQAFNPDKFGNTELRYLLELLPRAWGYGSTGSQLINSGLKIHPWPGATQRAHPWIEEL